MCLAKTFRQMNQLLLTLSDHTDHHRELKFGEEHEEIGTIVCGCSTATIKSNNGILRFATEGSRS